MLAAIEKFPGIRPDPEAFIEALDPLQPRLYSISSSPKADPGRVALTVDAVRYDIGGRERLGVASTFLADARRAGHGVKDLRAEGACLRPAGRSGDADHHDRPGHRRRAVPRLPAGAQGDPAQPAATGCSSVISAPIAISSTRTNSASMKAASVLTRLTLAWSRDSERRFTCRTACARSAAICGPGSPTARTSTSAATPSAWPRMSNSRWSISSRSTARAAPTRRRPSCANLKKDGRYQQDVY